MNIPNSKPSPLSPSRRVYCKVEHCDHTFLLVFLKIIKPIKRKYKNLFSFHTLEIQALTFCVCVHVYYKKKSQDLFN